MAVPVYYTVLGLEPSATDREIHEAFRRLAAQYHPGSGSGHTLAARRFRMVLDAYAVLGDPVRRAAYDRQLSTARRAARPEAAAAEVPPAATREEEQAALEPLPGARTLWSWPRRHFAQAAGITALFLILAAGVAERPRRQENGGRVSSTPRAAPSSSATLLAIVNRPTMPPTATVPRATVPATIVPRSPVPPTAAVPRATVSVTVVPPTNIGHPTVPATSTPYPATRQTPASTARSAPAVPAPIGTATAAPRRPTSRPTASPAPRPTSRSTAHVPSGVDARPKEHATTTPSPTPHRRKARSQPSLVAALPEPRVPRSSAPVKRAVRQSGQPVQRQASMAIVWQPARAIRPRSIVTWLGAAPASGAYYGLAWRFGEARFAVRAPARGDRA